MPEKINKMPEFYMIFARKTFLSRIFGASAPAPPPVSYAYGYIHRQSVVYIVAFLSL